MSILGRDGLGQLSSGVPSRSVIKITELRRGKLHLDSYELMLFWCKREVCARQKFPSVWRGGTEGDGVVGGKLVAGLLCLYRVNFVDAEPETESGGDIGGARVEYGAWAFY